jgi:hypothetical protein
LRIPAQHAAQGQQVAEPVTQTINTDQENVAMEQGLAKDEQPPLSANAREASEAVARPDQNDSQISRPVVLNKESPAATLKPEASQSETLTDNAENKEDNVKTTDRTVTIVESESQAQPNISRTEAEDNPVMKKTPVAMPVITKVTPQQPIAQARSSHAYSQALEALLKVWQKQRQHRGDSPGTIEHQLLAHGFQVEPLQSSLQEALKLNTPLLLEMRRHDQSSVWVAIIARRGYRWQLSPKEPFGDVLTKDEIMTLWSGRGYLPWDDPLKLADIDFRDAKGAQIELLQDQLERTNLLKDYSRGVFDRATIKAIGKLQASRGLHISGRLSNFTLVALYQSDMQLNIPKFRPW